MGFLSPLFIASIAALSTASDYIVTVNRISLEPILDTSNSFFNWTYNAALFMYENRIFIAPRLQNSTVASIYKPGPSWIGITELVYNLASDSFKVNPIVFSDILLQPVSGQPEECGVEDPRIMMNPFDQTFTMLFTAWNCTNPQLAAATTKTPLIASSWQRQGNVWTGSQAQKSSKSGSILYRDTPPHYMLWGDSGIQWASSNDGTSWTKGGPFIMMRSDNFDSNLCEGGPAPLKLSTSDYFYIYNSARSGYPSVKPGWDLQYNVGFAILNGSNPLDILYRCDDPILSPVLDWEVGNSTGTRSLTPDVVFAEGMVPYPNGQENEFLIVYGGADSVLGLAKVSVEIV
jgi:predicted GH43/DUF377 family glycosyl hydrolase